MPPRSYFWITAWFLFSAPMMIYDAGYCLLRPRSLQGGDLYWLWKPYEMYSQFDHVYGTQAFEEGDGFSNAAAVMNLIENALGIAYLVLVHIVPKDGLAPLSGYTAVTMTLAKTILWVSQEYFCGGCAVVGHNAPIHSFLFFVAPNIVWTSFSIAIMCRLGWDLIGPVMRGSQSPAPSPSPQADFNLPEKRVKGA